MRGPAGSAWLAALEKKIRVCETKWNCKVSEPFTLSYNFVAPVRMKDREAVVKVFTSPEDFDDELGTLKHYQHANACNVLDAIPDRAVLLLERLRPGRNLKSVNESEAILTVARLIQVMQGVPPPKVGMYPTVLDISLGLQALRHHFKGQAGPFKEATLQRVEKLFPQLISQQSTLYLLHGDLHHENILASNAGWKMIDPEGVLGSVEYELMPFMVNNLPQNGAEQTIKHRINEFANHFGIEGNVLLKWGLCFSLLSAWWNIEDNIDLQPRDLDLVLTFDKLVSSDGA
jgi:streptomycin 6-kinase